MTNLTSEGRPMAERESNGPTETHLGWFFLGALAGVAAALLMAPKRGRETRDLLAEQGAEWWKKAHDAAGATPARTGEVLDRGRDYIHEQTDRLRSAFSAGRSAMREELRKGDPDRGREG
jgi:gas vesicle protein